jgi:hypothetical protein
MYRKKAYYLKQLLLNVSEINPVKLFIVRYGIFMIMYQDKK